MGTSLESSRPILAQSPYTPTSNPKSRASARYSSYSDAPTVATTHTSLSTASAQQEIASIEEGLDKLENKKLKAQRFVPTQEKTDDLSKLALGAKLERALGRRMGGQDAVMRVRVQGQGKKDMQMSEKDGEKGIVA